MLSQINDGDIGVECFYSITRLRRLPNHLLNLQPFVLVYPANSSVDGLQQLKYYLPLDSSHFSLPRKSTGRNTLPKLST